MVAILEKGEFKSDIHPMVDFLAASPLSLLRLAGSQPMLKSSYKAKASVIISIPPLVGGVVDVVVKIKGTGIPTASDELPLPEEVPTVSEEKFPLLKKRDATAEKIALLMKTGEVIEFGDSYEVLKNDAATGSASEGTATKKGKTVAVTTEDMQKRRNDVKARTTLLLALPDEHQLRFSKYKTAQELWAAILKTFGGNEATKKTKKNMLKQQYGNFKAEGSKTLEQTFNRLQVILAPEWLMHTIVWRNKSDLDAMSLDDLYNHLKVYEPEVQMKSESNSQNMAFISTAKNSIGNGEVNTADIPIASTQVSPAGSNVATASISLDTACAYIASQYNGSQIKYKDINQIDEDDIEEMDIKAPRSQDKGRRDNYRQGSKVEEQALKALMAINGVGWD
nr:ribonuclease H-like domain-containing protein [Tanacetum cinerariifolium]